MNRVDQVRIAMVATPVVASVALFIVAFSQQRHFAHDVEARQQTESQITALLKSLEEQASQPAGRQAAVPDLPTEESRYLTFIRSAAQSTGVKIIRWASNPRVPTTAAPTGPPQSAALNDVTPLSGSLEIAGSYKGVLAFTRQLESADRLLNLTNVSWNRPDMGFDVHLTAMVTRYVVKPVAPLPVDSAPVTAPAPPPSSPKP